MVVNNIDEEKTSRERKKENTKIEIKSAENIEKIE